jgi:hypothetical protein
MRDLFVLKLALARLPRAAREGFITAVCHNLSVRDEHMRQQISERFSQFFRELDLETN